LARYESKKKQKKTRILLYYWLPIGTYHLKIWQFEILFLQILDKSGPFFSHEKSIEIIVFQVEIWPNFGTKNKMLQKNLPINMQRIYSDFKRPNKCF
jgi:hypothetical protein